MSKEHQAIVDRVPPALAAKGIDVAALADLPMVEIAQAFARSGVPVAPAHYRPGDRPCSCGDLGCPVPGAHLVRRHQFFDPWSSLHTDAAHIDATWKSRPEAGVGFGLKLAGETYERRFSFDGAVIRECIQYTRIGR